MNANWKKDYPLATNLTETELGENHSLNKMFRLVGENKRVLDFGCATGYFAQLLTTKGCRVTGIELNQDAAKVAEQYCEQVIIADLDLVSLPEILPEQAFDVAIFGDVLEHLRDPWRILKETQKLLSQEGYIVASIPNIAHGSIRLALLQGKFEYTELGILDNTHLRFFTRKTVEELLEHSGYFIETIDRTKLPIFSNAPLIPQINKDDFNSEIIQQVEQDEEVDTLQFVLRAFPCLPEGKYAALNKRYLKIIAQIESLQTQLQQTQVETQCSQAQLEQTQAEFESLRTQLHQAHTELEVSQFQLQHTQTELEQSQALVQHTQGELQDSRSHVQQIQTELEQSQSQLQQTQTELDNSQFQLQHTQLELERAQALVQQTETEKRALAISTTPNSDRTRALATQYTN
jgi:2-polyprenyl-3-methyl-5-hydroxy-6-metoxy-1,4-benzoquinol methylase